MSSRGRRPVLVTFPADDAAFAEAATQFAVAASAPEQLQAALRQRYPPAVVRRREIANEGLEVWYVYRDGRWTPPGQPDTTAGESHA